MNPFTPFVTLRAGLRLNWSEAINNIGAASVMVIHVKYVVNTISQVRAVSECGSAKQIILVQILGN